MANNLYDNGEHGSPYLFAINALYWALQSMIAPEAKIAQTSVGFASDAAAAEDESELQETNISEETSWQVRALDVARAAKQAHRDMFSALSATPKWLERFQARKAP